MLVAFNTLKGVGFIHADQKPDHVMLANHWSEPFRVKLIDFDVSFTTLEKSYGMTVQPDCEYQSVSNQICLDLYVKTVTFCPTCIPKSSKGL